jgi:hypothetical protein
MFKTSRGTAGAAGFQNSSQNGTNKSNESVQERGESIREESIREGSIPEGSVRQGSTASILPGILDDTHYNHNGHKVTPGIQPAGESGKSLLRSNDPFVPLSLLSNELWLLGLVSGADIQNCSTWMNDCSTSGCCPNSRCPEPVPRIVQKE